MSAPRADDDDDLDDLDGIHPLPLNFTPQLTIEPHRRP
jgi:hypothetical protein